MATFDLDRFVRAQAPVYETALAELRAGEKRSHWMWFVFPQLRGLGRSAMAFEYGLESLDEARADLSHATLGPRLLACTGLVNRTQGRSIHAIFGSPDDMKFRSCMTLFAAVPGAPDAFAAALAKYFGGEPDAATLQKLNGG